MGTTRTVTNRGITRRLISWFATHPGEVFTVGELDKALGVEPYDDAGNTHTKSVTANSVSYILGDDLLPGLERVEHGVYCFRPEAAPPEPEPAVVNRGDLFEVLKVTTNGVILADSDGRIFRAQMTEVEA